MITASNFLTIILAAILIQQGAFTIGNMVSFQIYIDKLTTAISSLLSMNFSAQTAGVAVDRIIEILSKEREPADEEFEPIKISKVQFSDVSFSYSNRPPILKQISFTIDKPGIYTFVGENGCGKTTILKLLMRYYDSSAGQILINDTPLEKMPIALLRRSVGYYSKDVYIENTTLLENLTLGTGVCLSGGVPAKVIEVCQRVGLDDFISRLSKGYDTIVGEDGKLLSSGQMQKIAVVRAILGDFSVLIFDEITSDLDGSAEKEIMSILSNFAKEKIIIHVTHRIQAVEGSTDIFLLEDGVIKIHGTHEALLQKSGEYKAMFQSKAT